MPEGGIILSQYISSIPGNPYSRFLASRQLSEVSNGITSTLEKKSETETGVLQLYFQNIGLFHRGSPITRAANKAQSNEER